MDDLVHGEDGGLKLLLTVEQTFEIKGRGLIVVPGPLATAFSKAEVPIGTEIYYTQPQVGCLTDTD